MKIYEKILLFSLPVLTIFNIVGIFYFSCFGYETLKNLLFIFNILFFFLLTYTCFSLHNRIKNSMLDDLTLCLHKKPFFEKLSQELERAERQKQILSFMVIDIDDFKKINDTYGHDIGDKILIQLSNVIKENMRKYDTIGRVGGEEFAIIASNCSKDESIIIAERIRESIEKFSFYNNIELTVSIGISNNKHENIFRSADRAMYRSKDFGKNRVIFYEVE